MGGVDTLDSMLGRYKIAMRSKKWYFRLFYHLLDLSIINSWLLYRRCCHEGEKKNLSLAEFRIQLGLSLCKYGTSITPTRGRPRSDIQPEIEAKKFKGPAAVAPPQDVRLDQLAHWPEFATTRQRCKLPGCKLKSFCKCSKCSVHLCLNTNNNCFTKYHTTK